ncbi:MAG TPA: ATP-binding protein [Bryobacteraceae bacterium]|nr:ATP-binding protein [Bryobacteraceae bacterium]
MRRPSRLACEMRAMIPATLAAVEQFLRAVRHEAFDTLPRADGFAAELLVREALTNAVVHGCHSDPRKHILCVLRRRGRRLTIAVHDEGEGFDWRAARQRRRGVLASAGRGIQILRQYAVRVRYNEKGNAVTIIKQC